MEPKSPDKVTERPGNMGTETARSRRHRRARQYPAKQLPSNRASWGILVVLLAVAPLAFGAVEYWSIALVELMAVALALGWLIGGLRRNELGLQLSSPLLAVVGLTVWVAVELALGWTLDRDATRSALTLLICYLLVFLVVSNEQWSSRWIRRLGVAIAGIGFAEALFGIVQFFSWNEKLYWIRPIHEGSPFGSYVNHNHFSGLMEMTFPMAAGLALSERLPRAWRVLLGFFATVMALATLMSLSRGGMVSLGLGALLLVYVYSRRRGARRVLLTLGLLGAVAGGWLAWLGAGPVMQRFFTLRGLSQEADYLTRLWIARDTWHLIQDRPLTGTGFGTFATAIPRYISFYTNVAWQTTHNDYLQLLSEVGLVGFAFAVWWIVAILRRAWNSINDETRPLSTLRLGALCGCVSLLLHSFVDFNLQIPANAILFVVLAAIAARPDERPRVEPRPDLELETMPAVGSLQ